LGLDHLMTRTFLLCVSLNPFLPSASESAS